MITVLLLACLLIYPIYASKRFKNQKEGDDVIHQLNEQVIIPITLKYGHIYPRLKTVILKESSYRNPLDSSYTIDKGTIYMCIRKPDDMTKFYDLETLSLVLLHELSHVSVDSIGHDVHFSKVFESFKDYFYTNSKFRLPQTGGAYCGVIL